MEELWKSVDNEIPDPVQAEVTGDIPLWLAGNLYRNGPGKFEVGETKYNTWLDGMALLHRFHISEGKVEYRSKFLVSDTYKKNMEANRIIVTEFGTVAFPDPCKNIFQRFFSHFTLPKPTDNCVVNFFPIGESLYVATETQYLRKIDPETLDTLDKVDLKQLVSVNGATAHPHIDPDGCLHNLGAIHGKGFRYAIIKIAPPQNGDQDKYAEKAEIVATVTPESTMKPSYYHSFAMTENYYAFVESSLQINVLTLLTSHIRGKAFANSMEWHPEKLTKIYVVNKKTGEIVNQTYCYYMNAFFSFHHINAYEEDGHIVMDLVCMDDAGVLLEFNLDNLQREGIEERLAKLPKPQTRRIVIPLALDSVKGKNQVTLQGTKATAEFTGERNVMLHYESLTNIDFEFPQINYRKYNTRKYRYVYGVGYKKSHLDCLVKLDIETRESKVWYHEGHYPSEPVFVEAPDSTSEDDGLVLSVVLTTGESRLAYLLILDATSWQEKARAVVDVKMGMGTHHYFQSRI